MATTLRGPVFHAADPSTMTAERIRSPRFSTVFRGYDPNEVKVHLDSVAEAYQILLRTEGELRARLENNPVHVSDFGDSPGSGGVVHLDLRTDGVVIIDATQAGSDEDLRSTADTGKLATVTSLYPEAEEALADARVRAEAMLTAARSEAHAIVAKANDEAARIILRARAESRGRPTGDGMAVVEAALNESDGDPTLAKEQARMMIAEAKAVREKILGDLAKRRRVAHVQLEQMRVAKDRLTETMREARRLIDDASRDLTTAEAEARIAADAAGRRVNAEPMPTAADLEAELLPSRYLSGALLTSGAVVAAPAGELVLAPVTETAVVAEHVAANETAEVVEIAEVVDVVEVAEVVEVVVDVIGGGQLELSPSEVGAYDVAVNEPGVVAMGAANKETLVEADAVVVLDLIEAESVAQHPALESTTMTEVVIAAEPTESVVAETSAVEQTAAVEQTVRPHVTGVVSELSPAIPFGQSQLKLRSATSKGNVDALFAKLRTEPTGLSEVTEQARVTESKQTSSDRPATAKKSKNKPANTNKSATSNTPTEATNVIDLVAFESARVGTEVVADVDSPAEQVAEVSPIGDLAGRAIRDQLVRALKRVLLDEQSAVLSAVRKAKGRVDASVLLGTDAAHAARYTPVVQTAVNEMANLRGEDTDDRRVETIVGTLTASLRLELANDLATHGPGNDSNVTDLTDTMSAHYRAWTTDRLSELVTPELGL